MSTVDSTPDPSTYDILSLFYRMGEPIFFPKDDEEQTYFNVTPDFLPEKYKDKSTVILNRLRTLSGHQIDLSALDDALLRIPLDRVNVVKRRDNFSLFIPQHQKAAGRLIEIFMGIKTFDKLMTFASFIRDKVNPQLYVYALSTAILHRKDTEHLSESLPSYAEIFPQEFVATAAIAKAEEIAQIFVDPGDRIPTEIPTNLTGNDGDPEHRLAYFREDLGINLHHWHWHLIYPFEGPNIIVQKDRRGELFYFLHHQIIARYNIERLCNRLDLTKRLLDWNEPIKEAYFPMISTDVAGKAWPGRVPNTCLSNIDRLDRDLKFDIEDLKRYRDRIFEAIHTKKVLDINGNEIDIANDMGIDILGNIVESSTLSPNADYYGNLHNLGHLAIAYVNNPKYKYNQTTGVMSETTTAMRDPVFYRWHAFIDDIFSEHKNTLPPYDEQALTFRGIEITGFELCSLEDNINCKQNNKNILHTFMQKTDINLSRGLDFVPRGAILVRITHLNHERFRYNINVRNSTGRLMYGTVRIFMAPAFGFANTSMNLNDQRNLMIEVDRFVVILRPNNNSIVRWSDQSSVTIPFKQTFRNLDVGRPDEEDRQNFEKFNYCGCGWPQHMLIPKGTAGGYPMIAFAMITNYNDDKTLIGPVESYDENGCKNGLTFCGLRDKKYPDKRPMGFPFDRPMRSGVDTLESFLTPNMAMRPITIMHSDITRTGNLVSKDSIPANTRLNPRA